MADDGDGAFEELAELIGQHALGFDEVRPEQKLAAAAALEGRDVLVVLPTGAGKSAIYQIVGPARPGPSIVVSPLLALQADQVRSIGGRLGGAAVISSELSPAERADTLSRIAAHDVEFVFCAPEQLANEDVRRSLAASEPSLFVVDEAHLIVSWGRDFRPDYLRLGAVAAELGRPPIMALTATAAPPVREAIAGVLGLDDPVLVVGEVARENIALEVVSVADAADTDTAVVERASAIDGTGIVYVARRADAERLATLLTAAGRPALAYHAGLGRRQRAAVLERFAAAEPVVVVATIAFGLGIDVPHVRFVIHADVPEDLDAYYQEVGRAGRDGLPAVGCLVVAGTGGRARAFMAGGTTVDDETLSTVAEVVGLAGRIRPEEVVQVARRTKGRVLAALELLERAGAVVVEGADVITPGLRDAGEALAAARDLRDHEEVLQRTRVAMVDRYLSGDACRWSVLAGYLGDPSAAPCGTCDVCRRGPVAPVVGPFLPGSSVVHSSFGVGTVVERDAESLTVLFGDAGYRRLALGLVDDLLVAADAAGLESLPRARLLDLAAEHGVPGRSRMGKPELAVSLAAALATR